MNSKVCRIVAFVFGVCLFTMFPTYGTDELISTGGTLFDNGHYSTKGPEKVFDGVKDTWDSIWEFYNSSGTPMLGYGWQEQKVLTSYGITAYIGSRSQDPNSWVLEGSNDSTDGVNGTWSILDEQSNQSFTAGESKYYSINNQQGFSKYRLKFPGVSVVVEEIEFFGKSKATIIEESISIESQTNEVQIGKTFTIDVVLHNAKNICAEDVLLKYDQNLFEYLGSETIVGFKTYKEIPSSTEGAIRFIVASTGKDFAINGDKTFIKLKFKAKKQGTGIIDSVTARIADNGTLEKDLKIDLCGQKAITVKGIQDVNRSGSFTLLDLGIDAWYHGSSVDNTDKTKYDTDVVVDNTVDDFDLTAIVDAMLENTDYKPHNL